jgi:asparagine synthase (glutamine-hydrolysing)
MESGQYLRNQLLRDADWASMASSLEVRVPFVDAWLRDQALRLGFAPVRRSGKRELARLAAPELPAAVLRRRKTGFSIPVGEWLSGASEGRAPGRGEQSRRLARWLLEARGISLGG